MRHFRKPSCPEVREGHVARRAMLPLLVLLIGSAACGGGSSGPTDPGNNNNNNPPQNNSPASLQVSVLTDGNGTDADGYTLTLNGASPTTVSANGSTTFSSLTPKTYAVAIAGNDGRCYLLGPRIVNVALSAGQNGTLSFHVRCFHQPIGFTQSNDNDTQMVMLVDDDGSWPTEFGHGTVNVEPVWSRDGSRVAYGYGDATTHIWEMQLGIDEPAGGASKSAGVIATPRSWSPDGSKLLAIGYSQFLLYDVASGQSANIGPQLDDGAGASFSPDGSRVMLTSIINDPLSETLWVGPSTGSGMTQVAGGGSRQYLCKVWSPDGSEIYCNEWTPDDFELVAVKADGSGERTILSTATLAGMGATWLVPQTVIPGDTKIVLALFFSDRRSLYAVAPDGSGLTDLSQAPTGAHDFISDNVDGQAWSADGSTLLFLRTSCPQNLCAITINTVEKDGTNPQSIYSPSSPYGIHGSNDVQWVP